MSKGGKLAQIFGGQNIVCDLGVENTKKAQFQVKFPEMQHSTEPIIRLVTGKQKSCKRRRAKLWLLFIDSLTPKLLRAHQ